MIPACRWGVYGFRPSSYRPRRVFAEGDQHRMVTIPDPRQSHIPRAFPQCFAAAGGERIHSLALRACTRSRVPPTSTQREQVDRAFRSPRFRSLTDPLACASSLYALARPPASTQREQVDRAFWAPRFGSLTDPLACASSLYALARSPYKHAARASGSSVLGASLPVLNGPTRLRFELVRAGAFSLSG